MTTSTLNPTFSFSQFEAAFRTACADGDLLELALPTTWVADGAAFHGALAHCDVEVDGSEARLYFDCAQLWNALSSLSATERALILSSLGL